MFQTAKRLHSLLRLHFLRQQIQIDSLVRDRYAALMYNVGDQALQLLPFFFILLLAQCKNVIRAQQLFLQLRKKRILKHFRFAFSLDDRIETLLHLSGKFIHIFSQLAIPHSHK